MSLIIATGHGLSSVEEATGNLIKTYKTAENVSGGTVLVKAASSGQPASVLTVQKDKPLIHHYALRKESVAKRIVLPAKVEALAISPNSQWLAAGSKNGTLYVWNLWSGELKTLHSEAHFQALTCMSWSKDSSVLVTGGDDARVLVWRTLDLVSNQGMAPKHIFTSHTLPITSCIIGTGTFREARLYTASLDATVSVYDIYSGRLLYTVACDTPLRALAVDPAERALYLGGDNGVRMVPLYYEPQDSSKLVSIGSNDGSVVSTNDIERIFKTGENKVSALELSTDASHLFVGCDDGSVSSWEVGSGQQVKKFRSSKGAVTSLIFAQGEFATAEEFEVLPVLQRNLSSKQDTMDFVPHGQLPHGDIEALGAVDSKELEEINNYESRGSAASAPASNTETDGIQEDDSSVAAELKELKERHEQLKKMYDALWARHTSK